VSDATLQIITLLCSGLFSLPLAKWVEKSMDRATTSRREQLAHDFAMEKLRTDTLSERLAEERDEKALLLIERSALLDRLIGYGDAPARDEKAAPEAPRKRYRDAD
jgi:hypothetical protein